MLVIGSILLYLPFISPQIAGAWVGLAYYGQDSAQAFMCYVLACGLRLLLAIRQGYLSSCAARGAAWRPGALCGVIWGVIALAPWVILAIWGRWGRLLLGLEYWPSLALGAALVAERPN
jgi:hypothetical protein